MMRNTIQYLQAWTFATLLMFYGIGMAGKAPIITPFSAIDPAAGIPDAWKPLTFPKIPTQTDYRPISIDGRIAIEARSQGGASGLVHKLDVNPIDSPWLSWQWRVDRALEESDVTTKAGDDCAARIYIAFEFVGRDKSWWERFEHGTERVFAGEELPGSAIVYAWTSGIDVGSIIDSPYTDQSKLIAVQSGNDLKGRWVSEKRNIVDDYLTAYGILPPAIIGIAIMTDTDNTGTETTAYYGDIRLERE